MVGPILTELTNERPLKEKVREAYLDRPERPTYEELSIEFGVKDGTIKNWASDESWVRMRIARQEQLADKSDALGVVLRAVKTDAKMLESFSDFALAAFSKLTRLLMDIDDKRAVSSRATVINTLTFAALNLCNSAKALGIVGVPKGLADAGKEDNGKWNPQFLVQINNTMQELQARKSAAAPAEPVETTAKPPTENQRVTEVPK